MAIETSTPAVSTGDSVQITTLIAGDTAVETQNPYGTATATIAHDKTSPAGSPVWQVDFAIDITRITDDAADGAGAISAIADIIAHFQAVKTRLEALVPGA